MSPMRMRMIEDMVLAGLAKSTQAVYVKAVCKLTAHYGRSPDTFTEEEVRAYLVSMRERGWRAERLRPITLAFSFSTAKRSIASGRCF